jgi:sodium transport system permease protein
MRWSIIRVIWFRELRDQLRDRRTIVMMAVLPLVLYPALGIGVFQFVLSFVGKPSVVGIYGGDKVTASAPNSGLPAATSWLTLTPSPGGCGIDRIAGTVALAETSHAMGTTGQVKTSLAPAMSWLAATPNGCATGWDRLLGAAALSNLGASGLGQDYPPLLTMQEGKPRFVVSYFESPAEAGMLQALFLEWSGDGVSASGELLDRGTDWVAAVDRGPLDSKQVDLLLIIPPDFQTRLQSGDRPAVYIMAREGDDRSRLVSARLNGVLGRWKKRIKEIRLLRIGLSPNFDDPVIVRDSEKTKSLEKRAAEDLFEILVRVFPFVLVMWALAGALYPAVDLCAGEKERGTMETLLITPASREEIVWGKFLTISVFSAVTALLNLLSMGVTATLYGSHFPHAILRPISVLWSLVLLLPLAAFFSAICLAVGAYARSSKEGQHYLMPLFLVTMPLIFLTLAPGVELSPFFSMIPITGVALLLQKLIAAGSLEQVPWLYFVPVLAPMTLYGWFALRWAIEQFKREEVLFREAERLELGLWFRSIFNEKLPLPSTAQALTCFAAIVLMHWIAFGVGDRLSLLGRSGVGLIAFVATPTFMMALLLTTRPDQALGLQPAPSRYFASAAVLALVLLPPLSEFTMCILRQFPVLMDLMMEHSPLTSELRRMANGGQSAFGLRTVVQYFLVFVLLPAVCEELAFRGFILAGLRRRFKPWMAILLSSCLFALYHFNVFQLLPAFCLGLVLGLLAVRSGSVLPGMLFHFLHNGLLIILVMLDVHGYTGDSIPGAAVLRLSIVLCSCLAAMVLLRRLVVLPAEAELPPLTQLPLVPGYMLRASDSVYCSSSK